MNEIHSGVGVIVKEKVNTNKTTQQPVHNE